MTSPGNATNLESAEHREIGIGYLYDGLDQNNVSRDFNGDCIAESPGWGPYYTFWTIVLGRSDDIYPIIINREAAQVGTSTVELYIYGEGWAEEMRLRNEGGTWSAWMPFASEMPWQLTSDPGHQGGLCRDQGYEHWPDTGRKRHHPQRRGHRKHL